MLKIALIILPLLLNTVDATFRILQPTSYQFIDSEAQFGTPEFGGSILGGLWYGTPGDRDGCAALPTGSAAPWATALKNNQPIIILVDRGNCTFVQKVRNAQNAAATAVVIMDNQPEGYLPIMADDGTGGSIYVPSVLISYADGVTVKNVVNSSPVGTVLAEVSWDIPQQASAVDLQWWMSSDDLNGQFKKDFAIVAESLGSRLNMDANYKIYDGTAYGCTVSPTACGTLCTNGGLYCYNTPDSSTGKIYTGADIVQEDLRQMCIFKQANATNSINNYWNYISLFGDNCNSGNGASFTYACSVQQQTSAGISSAVTDACVAACGGTTTGHNSCLDASISKASLGNINILPSLFINTRPFTGTLECQLPISISTCTLLKAVCAGYAYSYQPPQCKANFCWGKTDCSGTCGGTKITDSCNICLDASAKNGPLWNTCYGCDNKPNSGLKVDQCGVCGGDGTFDACGRCFPKGDSQRIDDPTASCDQASSAGGVNTGSITLVGIVVGGITVVILGAGFFVFIRHRERRMRLEMENVLQRYRPLEEANDFVQTGRNERALEKRGLL